MGKILVAVKPLNLGVRGPGEKPSSGETRSSGTGGSRPGQESWSVSGGEAHIPQSLRTKANQEGWPSCKVEYRSGGTGGPHPGVDIFPDLSPRAKPYCGVKCSQRLHFPATTFIGKQDGSSTSHNLMKERDHYVVQKLIQMLNVVWQKSRGIIVASMSITVLS